MSERTKELAEQAGFDQVTLRDHKVGVRHSNGSYVVIEEELERFAELIRADERDKCAQDYLKDCNNTIEAAFNECKKEIEHNHKVLNIMIDTARKDEREACAKLCEENMFFATGEHHAKAIRQRGDSK